MPLSLSLSLALESTRRDVGDGRKGLQEGGELREKGARGDIEESKQNQNKVVLKQRNQGYPKVLTSTVLAL